MYCPECGAVLDGGNCGVCGAEVKRPVGVHDQIDRSVSLDLADDNPYTPNTALQSKVEEFSDFLLPNIIITPFACVLCFGLGGLLSFIGAIFAIISRISRTKGELDHAKSCANVSKALFGFVCVITIIAVIVVFYA